MLRIILLALAMFSSANAVLAEVNLSISLNAGPESSLISETYVCDGDEPLAVQYVNSGANALAILQIDGSVRIFVNVISASGAKYVSGSYTWWTKGDAATLENETASESIKNCQAQVSQ